MADKRRNLTPEEMLAAAEALQIALLDGISRARRWGKSELAFQGGTSLHLAYGSPRASEDLDFIIASDRGLNAIMASALAHARAYVRQAVGPAAELEIKARGKDAEDQAAKNPRIFTVAFKAPAFLQAVKVKVEFYVADPAIAAGYASDVRAARLSQEARMRRPIKLAISQAIVPTGRLTEIFADKIYAIAGRPYLKYRDVFDLWWLDQQGAALRGDALLDALANRHALYPSGPAIDAEFARTLLARADEVVKPANLRAFSKDLARWLALSGSALLAEIEHARSIAQTAADHIRAAAQLVRAPKRAPDR